MSKLKEILDKIALRLNKQDKAIECYKPAIGPIVGTLAGTVRLGSVSKAGTSRILFTAAEIEQMMDKAGISYREPNYLAGASKKGEYKSYRYMIIANNGDGNANAAHVDGVTFLQGTSKSTQTWYVVFDRATAGAIRINYLIFIIDSKEDGNVQNGGSPYVNIKSK